MRFRFSVRQMTQLHSSIQATVLFLFLALCRVSFADQTLVHYDFEANDLAAGPDTFQIFQPHEGTVSLSDTYAYNGYTSLLIGDVVDDGSFPEFQGYYPEVTNGFLYFHFAFMTTKPKQSFNIALAGKGHYQLIKNGIGFWLSNEGGVLSHHPDGEVQPLMPLRSHLWYAVDVSVNIDLGRYHLIISDEYDEPIVELSNQLTSANLKGSSLNQYSFIGDLQDKFSAEYYVDEVRIEISNEKQLEPFVAPGRRKLFVDIWDDYHFEIHSNFQCIPSFSLIDFGFTDDGAYEMNQELADELDVLFKRKPADQKTKDQIPEPKDLTPKKPKKPKALATFSDERLFEIQVWLKGCDYLAQQQGSKALEQFTLAYERKPDAVIYQLAMVLGYASVGNDDAIYQAIHQGQSEDPRWNILMAMLALHKEEFYDAEGKLLYTAPQIPDEFSQPALKELLAMHSNADVIARLKKNYPNSWQGYMEKAIEAEQYFYALLWLGEFTYASDYANAMETAFLGLGLKPLKWIERQGDAAFFDEQYDAAREAYLAVLKLRPAQHSATLKLADIYYLMGDRGKEIALRENIYGRLQH